MVQGKLITYFFFTDTLNIVKAKSNLCRLNDSTEEGTGLPCTVIIRLKPKNVISVHPTPPPPDKNISLLAQREVRGASVVFQNWF